MEKKLVFYHGTDARIVRMSQEERNCYFADCNLIIDALWPFYEALLEKEYIEKIVHGEKRLVERLRIDLLYQNLFEGKGELDYYDLREKILMLRDCKRGIELYQYGNFYVATTKSRASSYALRSFAGGELGLITYRLIQGAQIIKFDNFCPNTDVDHAMSNIIEMATSIKREPVVFKLENLNIDNLQWEDGRPIDKKDEMTFIIMKSGSCSLRYCGDVVLDINNAEFI